MKGIPVRRSGDPVHKTFVIAGSHGQFVNWCYASRVNPRSRMVSYLAEAYKLRGCRDVDVVYTGTGYAPAEIAMDLQIVGVREWYYQYESCEIDPYIIDDEVDAWLTTE